MNPADRRELAEMFRERGYKVGAEIGVADGRYSLLLCEAIPGLKLYCIDPWEPYRGNRRGGGKEQQHGNYELAQQRLSPFDVEFIRTLSVIAADDFTEGELDFVYIDANHDFDYVMLDLIHWAPKVREGGVVSGHDYYDFAKSGVIEAVDAYTAAHGIEFQVTGRARRRREREPSWWWTK